MISSLYRDVRASCRLEIDFDARPLIDDVIDAERLTHGRARSLALEGEAAFLCEPRQDLRADLVQGVGTRLDVWRVP